MAKPKKAAAPAAAVVSPLLLNIVGFGVTGGYVAKSAELAALVAEGKVEQGPDDANGNAAVRATAAGIAAATSPAAAAPAAFVAPAVAEEAPKRVFSLVMGVVPAPRQRGGNKGKSIYPFGEMQVGHSFFIPATADKPEPWKSLASTATSATRRYDEPVMDANGQAVMENAKVRAHGKPGEADYKPEHYETRQKMRHTRVFVMQQADGGAWGQPGVAGAAVYRTV